MTSTPQGPAGAYKYYVLVILILVNTTNFIDRQVIGVLAPSIKRDLIDGSILDEWGVGNLALGLVMGIAFTAFYATLGFPIARLADRRNRVTILAVVMTIWSGMTALCGAASNFAMLFLFRVGVGIGEAGAGPCSHSILADYFVKKHRPAVLGAFSMGVPLGIFIGLTGGGLLVGALDWRLTFVIMGIPGIVLAIILKLTVREPVRGGLDDPADASMLRADEEVKFWPCIKALWSVPTFRIMALSAAPSSLCGYGMNLWTPSFLSRVHELPEATFGLPLGLATGVGGGLGVLLGGWLTSLAGARDARAFLTLPAASMVVFAVALGVAIWSSSLPLAYSAIFVAAFTQFFLMGPFFGVVQRLAPLRGRALATAFFFFILSAVGLGIGPAYVGLLNDLLRSQLGDAEGLRWALFSLTIISAISGGIALLGRGQIARDLGMQPAAPTGAVGGASEGRA
jgi:MFS family permease